MTQEISVTVADKEPIIVGMAILVAKVSVACIAPAGMIDSATRKRRRGDRNSSSPAVVVAVIYDPLSDDAGAKIALGPPPPPFAAHCNAVVMIRGNGPRRLGWRRYSPAPTTAIVSTSTRKPSRTKVGAATVALAMSASGNTSARTAL